MSKSMRLIIDKEVLILFKHAFKLYGRKLFCRRNKLSYVTLSKKISQCKCKSNIGGKTPIFSNDIEDWFYGITMQKWVWYRSHCNHKINKDNKNLDILRQWIADFE